MSVLRRQDRGGVDPPYEPVVEPPGRMACPAILDNMVAPRGAATAVRGDDRAAALSHAWASRADVERVPIARLDVDPVALHHLVAIGQVFLGFEYPSISHDDFDRTWIRRGAGHQHADQSELCRLRERFRQ